MHARKMRKKSAQAWPLFLFIGIFLIFLIIFLTNRRVFLGQSRRHGRSGQQETSKFQGNYWKTEQTIKARPVVSTMYAACEMHTVRQPNGQLVHDWLWWDEFDQVGVVVHLEESNKFLFYRGTQYASVGSSLLPISGLVDVDEEPLAAAKRQLHEETGLEAKEFVSLGKYRTSATRGGGHVHLFLASQAHLPPDSSLQNLDQALGITAERNSNDGWAQLDAQGVRNAASSGDFGDVRWTAAASLASLWIKSNMS